MIEVLISRNGNKLTNKGQLISVINSLKDGHYRVTIKDARTRSHPQNDYYWAVVVPAVKRGLVDAGYDDVQSEDDAHEMIKQEHLKRRMYSRKDGNAIDIARSTAKLTVTEFNEFLERVCKWAAEYLMIAIPSPNETIGSLDKYVSSLNETIEL